MTVSVRGVARSAYRFAKRLPLVGPLAAKTREMIRSAPRINVFAAIAQLQERTHAYGVALTGLREANQRLRAGLIEELDHRFHHQNLKIDREREEVTKRVEFIRAEALLEVRRLVRADLVGGRGASEIIPAILSPDKVERCRQSGALRLNVGCGHIPISEYINIDYRELPGVDVVAAVDKLPFGLGEVSEIYGAHIAEHFPEHVFKSQVLPAWRACLRAKGLLRLVVPNTEAMMQEWQSGAITFDTLSMIVMGGQEYEGDFHYAMYNPNKLQKMLLEAGFVNAVVVAHARRNGQCLETEVTAIKP